MVHARMALKLNRQRLEQAYSLLLIILIPAAVIAGTLWLTSQVKSNFDQELRRKANLANEVFGVSAINILAANEPSQAAALLQQLIDQIRKQAPEIENLSIIQPVNGVYRTLASSNTVLNGKPDTTIQTQLAWSKGQPVASLIASGEGNDRQWLVATPLLGPSGQPIAVSRLHVNLRSSDALINATLSRAFVALSIMVLVIMLLMLNHFRLVEYAELFRKQKELDQMKDDFISIATHELKAPMSVIKGYISMALEEKLSKPVRDMLTIGFEQTDRLGHLVTDLLDVSRLEQGKTKYKRSLVPLPSIINPMVVTYSAKAKEKGLQLVYQPAADLPAAVADLDRVSEVFTNLIDNAIKYSRSGTVSIVHTVEPGMLITTVSDTGIGLTADEMAHLFSRFYRAQNADTRDIAGTGLGLWIIKQYIEHMGGTIRVESEKGKGSSFIVALPLALERPAQPKA